MSKALNINRITTSKHWKSSSEDQCEMSFVLFKLLTTYFDSQFFKYAQTLRNKSTYPVLDTRANKIKITKSKQK